MSDPKNYRPKPGSMPDLMGTYLYNHGPQPDSILAVQVAARGTPDQQVEAVQRGLRTGWLTTIQDGRIDCSDMARAHYDRRAGIVRVKPMGEIAAPREHPNAFGRPPLRQAYMLNSRGIREVDPRFQRPAGFGFKHMGGGKA